jgi:hypothetical protein
MNSGPPYFIGTDKLDAIVIEIGSKLYYKLPQVSDPDPLDKVTITVELSRVEDFVKFLQTSQRAILLISPKQ